MSMSDRIKQQILHEVFGKRQNWILLFYQSWRTSTHIETILPIWSRGSVAHCFNLLHNVRYRTTERKDQIGDRGLNPVAINQFLNFFSLLCPPFLVFFLFANILYFTCLTSFDSMLL